MTGKPVKMFYFHKITQERFTNGDCEYLADALTRFNGIKYVLKLDNVMIHYVVKFENFFIDIEGIWTKSDLLKHWRWKNTIISLEESNNPIYNVNKDIELISNLIIMSSRDYVKIKSNL